ncbi:MAG TPA: hypothetical protein VIM73_14135, partial [Polyangiaceae bacterium]
MRIVGMCLLSAIALVPFGCAQDKAPPLTPAAGTVEEENRLQSQRAKNAEQMYEAIAKARCEREQRCERIGPD